MSSCEKPIQLCWSTAWKIADRNWRRSWNVKERACVDYGIHTLGLRRIVANMPCDHIASMRVAERLGMQREATFLNLRNRNLLTYLYSFNL